MPGICGFTPGPAGDADALLERMLDSMQHADWYRVERAIDGEGGIALGRVSLGLTTTAPQPARAGRDGLWVVVDGEIYNAAELAGSGAGGTADPARDPAAILLRGYAAEGRAFLTRVRGKFSAAIWDGRERRLILVNDCFGMKPLYYARAAGRLVFASEIKAILADADVSREQSRTGIVQFFSFGQLWNDETLFESVRVLPPAAWLVYELDRDRVTLERYRESPPPAAAVSSGTNTTRAAAELTDRVDAAFGRAVDEQTRATDGLGLSLSGGMDSRTVLAAIDTARVGPTCVCMGMRGSQDHVRAVEMARLAGCRYEQYELGGGFLTRFHEHLSRMVELTDGHYLSQCIVMPTLNFYRDVGIRVLLRGHAGELMHLQKAYNFSHDREAFELPDAAALERWLSKRLRAYMLDGLDEPLFAFADAADVDAIARDSLRESLAATSGWGPPVQRISHLFLTQRLRRETAMSLVKFGSVVETRVPYLDPELIDLLLAAPAHLRTDDRVQTEILRRRRPAFLRVRNVNTGARVDAGPLARRWGSFQQRVLAKLGVPGYQPYERLGLWLRRELKPLVASLLLDDRCLERGVFHPDALRRVVAQHMEHRRNHTFLLLALMIFEEGQRQLTDRVPAEPAELVTG